MPDSSRNGLVGFRKLKFQAFIDTWALHIQAMIASTLRTFYFITLRTSVFEPKVRIELTTPALPHAHFGIVANVFLLYW